MNDLNKACLVTGGSRGIGLAICKKLLEAGARIALTGRNADTLQSALAELGNDSERILTIQSDASDSDQAKAAIQATVDKFGSLDVLVNNAGITRDNLLMRMSDDDWSQVLDVNLRGAFNMIRAASRIMMKQRSGRIINITSVVGQMGNAGQTNYAASKAGLIGLTKSVARELASRNVTCNAIAPGYIDTEMTGNLPEEVRAAFLTQIPLGRLGSGENVADAVIFLASEGAAYITGQTINVDGGMVMI